MQPQPPPELIEIISYAKSAIVAFLPDLIASKRLINDQKWSENADDVLVELYNHINGPVKKADYLFPVSLETVSKGFKALSFEDRTTIINAYNVMKTGTLFIDNPFAPPLSITAQKYLTYQISDAEKIMYAKVLITQILGTLTTHCRKYGAWILERGGLNTDPLIYNQILRHAQDTSFTHLLFHRVFAQGMKLMAEQDKHRVVDAYRFFRDNTMRVLNGPIFALLVTLPAKLKSKIPESYMEFQKLKTMEIPPRAPEADPSVVQTQLPPVQFPGQTVEQTAPNPPPSTTLQSRPNILPHTKATPMSGPSSTSSMSSALPTPGSGNYLPGSDEEYLSQVPNPPTYGPIGFQRMLDQRVSQPQQNLDEEFKSTYGFTFKQPKDTDLVPKKWTDDDRARYEAMPSLDDPSAAQYQQFLQVKRGELGTAGGTGRAGLRARQQEDRRLKSGAEERAMYRAAAKDLDTKALPKREKIERDRSEQHEMMRMLRYLVAGKDLDFKQNKALLTRESATEWLMSQKDEKGDSMHKRGYEAVWADVDGDGVYDDIDILEPVKRDKDGKIIKDAPREIYASNGYRGVGPTRTEHWQEYLERFPRAAERRQHRYGDHRQQLREKAIKDGTRKIVWYQVFNSRMSAKIKELFPDHDSFALADSYKLSKTEWNVATKKAIALLWREKFVRPVVNGDAAFRALPDFQLYDLKTDPDNIIKRPGNHKRIQAKIAMTISRGGGAEYINKIITEVTTEGEHDLTQLDHALDACITEMMTGANAVTENMDEWVGQQGWGVNYATPEVKHFGSKWGEAPKRAPYAPRAAADPTMPSRQK